MSNPSVTYTFSNSTTADATQINQNFTDLINGLSDGTKDLSISALTVAGTATLNGAVNLGNATSDDITITGYLASSFIPKTNQTYDIGTADLGLRALYLGVASAGALTAKVIASASIAADRIYTMPEAGADASFVMTAGTQTISGAKTFDTAGNAMKGITSGSAIAAGYIGETIESSSTGTAKNLTNNTYVTFSNNTLGGVAGGVVLTPGKWSLTFSVIIEGSNSANYYSVAISTSTGSVTPYSYNGENAFDILHNTPVSGIINSVTIANVIVNLSSTTNYYGIVAASNNPTVNTSRGRLTAIRIG